MQQNWYVEKRRGPRDDRNLLTRLRGTWAEFFNGLLRAPPSFAPYATPAYTNTGYQILAYALEGIKGKSFQTMMEESVLRPLGLSHTYYQNAPESEGIIPGTPKDAEWTYQLGDENP